MNGSNDLQAETSLDQLDPPQLPIPPARPRQFPRATPEEVEALQSQLMLEARLSVNFTALVVASCLIATLGLYANSVAVIIGAMLIAPLMLPIRAVALALLDRNLALLEASLVSMVVGTSLAIGLSCGVGSLIDLPSWGSEILARTQPTLLDLGVALAAGFIGAFAKVRRNLADSLAGVAIAVALMPPVCVMGLGLSQLNWQITLGAGLLYLTNLLGIALACMVTFLVLGYGPLKQGGSSLVWVLLLVGVLILPLGGSFTQLLTQVRLAATVRQALLQKTVTFQTVFLEDTEFNWVANPPQVRLRVQSAVPITPRQVELLEDFVEQELNQPFQLIFQVSSIQTITREMPTPYPTVTPVPPEVNLLQDMDAIVDPEVDHLEGSPLEIPDPERTAIPLEVLPTPPE